MSSKIPALACLLVFSCTGILSAAPEYKQPRMELVVQYLQDALKANDPVPLMRQAKGELERVNGKGERAAFRDRAIKIIDDGLADAQGGHQDKVHGDITTALAAVQSGMSHTRGK